MVLSKQQEGLLEVAEKQREREEAARFGADVRSGIHGLLDAGRIDAPTKLLFDKISMHDPQGVADLLRQQHEMRVVSGGQGLYMGGTEMASRLPNELQTEFGRINAARGDRNYLNDLSAVTMAGSGPLELSAGEVQEVLDGLMKKHLVTDRSGGVGGRVTRYRQRLCNTQFGSLTLSPREIAIICELLLRGAQTPGELRSRASRMAPLRDGDEVEAALADLAAREDPLVAQLAREPGRRESRWMQLFTGDVPPEARHTAEPVEARAAPRENRLDSLEARIETLEGELEALRRRLDAFSGQQ
jgi:uncharacterized protein YceH (UPF0502 family)